MENINILLYSLVLMSSILMQLSLNPINSVFFFMSVYISASVILILMNIDFIGLLILIVYIGAIAVLFLFIVMMLNIKRIESDPTTYLLLGTMIILILVIQFTYMLVYNITSYIPLNLLIETNLFFLIFYIIYIVSKILLIFLLGYIINLKQLMPLLNISFKYKLVPFNIIPRNGTNLSNNNYCLISGIKLPWNFFKKIKNIIDTLIILVNQPVLKPLNRIWILLVFCSSWLILVLLMYYFYFFNVFNCNSLPLYKSSSGNFWCTYEQLELLLKTVEDLRKKSIYGDVNVELLKDPYNYMDLLKTNKLVCKDKETDSYMESLETNSSDSDILEETKPSISKTYFYIRVGGTCFLFWLVCYLAS